MRIQKRKLRTQRLAPPLALATAAVLAAASASHAVDVAWDGGAGANHSWHLASNWTSDTVPTFGSKVTLGSGITSGLVIDFGGGNPLADQLIISTTNAFTVRSNSQLQNEVFHTGGILTRQDLPGIEADQNILGYLGTNFHATWDVNGSGWLTVLGVFEEGGSFDFTKTGNGNLNLSNISTTGNTNVTNGILRVFNIVSSKALFVSSELQMEAMILLPAATMHAMENSTLHHLSGTSSLSQVTLDGNNVRLISDSGSMRINGGITDNGSGYSIIKSGAGTVFLNGPGNYSGTTSVQDGTLQLGVSNALGSGLTTVRGGAILQLGVSGGANISSPIALNGGTLTTQNNSIVTGPITLANNGTVDVPANFEMD